jgi:preprotein translocase subunit SecD
MTRRTGPTDLAKAMDRLARRMDRDGSLTRARVVAEWPQVAGPQIADHTLGLELRGGGELVVYVDSHTWANELTLLSDRLVTDLQERAGKRSVRSIRFTVSRKVAEEHRWRRERSDVEETYSEDTVDPVPVTANEMAQIEHLARGIEPASLREAAVRAMRADLEWRKGLKARKTAQRGAGGATGTESTLEH